MLDKFQSVDVMQQQVAEGYHYYQINHADQLVGYLAFILEAEHLFLSKIYLHSNQRGLGLGREAMDFVLQQAKAHMLNKVRLTVNKYNQGSIAVYKKLGFVVLDSVVMDIGGGFVMDDYVMDLTLNK